MTKKPSTSIFISDQSIGLFYDAKGKVNKAKFMSIQLPEGTVVEGYIKDPYGLKNGLKKLFKKVKLHPKSVKMIINDANALIRTITISSEDIKEQSLDDYLNQSIEKIIKHPFEKATYSYAVLEQTKESTTLALILVDEMLLQHYYDVLNSLWVFEIQFDLALSALYQLYRSKTTDLSKQLMQVTLYDHEFTISIIEEGIPVFLMTEEFQDDLYDTIETYMERISNYYRYNLRKGKKSIDLTLIHILSNQIDKNIIEQRIVLKLNEFNGVIFNFDDQDSPLLGLPLNCYLPYAGSKSDSEESKVTPFKLIRSSKRVHIANLMFLLAFTVFSIAVLIYIPYHLAQEKIQTQMKINQTLENYYDFIKEQRVQIDYQQEIAYNQAYHFLEKEQFHLLDDRLIQINNLLDASIDIVKIQLNDKTKTMVLTIQSDDVKNLHEFVINLYETHGMLSHTVTHERWITQLPSQTMKSNYVMEVVIVYAK